MRFGSTRLGDHGGDFFNEGVDIVPMTFVESAHRAFHFGLIGNDVGTVTRLKAADRHHRWLLRQIHSTRDNGLQTKHHLRANHDRIDTAPWLCAVRLVAADKNTKLIGAGHERTRPVTNLTRVHLRGNVQTKDGVDRWIFQTALFDHQFGAALFADRRHFFGGLENELDGAGDLIAHPGENFGNAHQDGHVGIVAAGVHGAARHAVPLRSHHTLERHVCFFDHRQRIHICAQCDARPRLAALQHADHAGVGDLFVNLVDADCTQMVGDQFAGAKFTIAELRVGVNVASPCDDGRVHAFNLLVDQFVPGENGVSRIHVSTFLG